MIVVTGAAGFIGSNIVWELNRRGVTNIIVVDIYDTDAENANLLPLDYERYMEKDEFRRWLSLLENARTVECLYHMGACSSTTETNAAYLDSNNFGYTRDLCLLCLDAGVRFINASSAATYGDGEFGYDDSHEGIKRLKPLNLYAKSKQDFDLWALAEGHLNSIVCLKFFNVYGPNEWHKGGMRSMVCKGFEQIMDSGVVSLFTSDRPEYVDGGQQRDFIYVKDAVDMTLWFAEHPAVNGIFNVGTAEANDWNRLISAIFKALDREPNIEYVTMPEHLRGKYQYHTQATMNKLRDAGYNKSVTVLEDAVADYVQGNLMTGRHLGA